MRYSLFPIAFIFSFFVFIENGYSQDCYVASKDSTVLADIYVPNVFTPNGDGSNDLFNVSSDCIFSLSKEVYNRWGELVFKSNQINEGWNGRTTAGAEVPEGTYFYVIDVGYYESGSESTKTFKGSVTLLR